MGKFSDIAKKSISDSGNLMAGREKITTDMLIAAYPQGVSINGVNMINYFDKVTRQDKTYPVFTFSEDDSKFYSGGKALARIVEKWLEMCNGDINEVNAGIADEPVKVKLEKVTTSKGFPFVKVEVIE